MSRCRWSNWGAEEEPYQECDQEATHTTCDPVGGVVCPRHKCRCSKPLAPAEKSDGA